jgi:adenylate cyclase
VALVVALAIFAALVSAFFANRSFGRPISRIAGELRHIESFSLGEVRRIPTWLIELDDLSAALKRMATSLSSFSLFVPTEIVRSLIAQGIEPVPGGEQREITVMFADLPGFTRLTERHGASVTPFLTEFLTLATEVIHQEGGMVDKFIGDCIMGIWNAPGSVADHAMHACRAAQTIRELMHRVERPDGATTGSRVRIGISTGTAFVGNIGSLQRLSYTAIGDVVNIASRLEALGKDFGVEIIVSETTKTALNGRAELRDLGASPIRGRDGALRVYELAGVPAKHATPASLAAAAQSHSAGI